MAGVPGIPTNVAAFPFNNRVLVSWTPSTGEVTQYTITASPGGKTVDVAGTATSGNLTGLTNGTSYTFTVTATNSSGSSAASAASNPVIPDIVRWRGVSGSESGAAHMSVIDLNGNLYMAGNNGFGQLGYGNTTSTSSFGAAVTISGEKVVGVASGGYTAGFTAAITASGKLYTWGYNGYGQLGLGNTTDKWTPQYISSLSSETVVGVSCGENHIAVVTSNGKVFACGLNNFYQTGPGSTANKTTFTQMTLPVGETAVNIDCAALATYIVTASGNLYTIGYDNLANPQTLTQISSGLGNELIAIVSATDAGCLIATRTGKVFGYGRNGSGVLGLGNYNNPISSLTQCTALANEIVLGIATYRQFAMFWTKTGKLYIVGSGPSFSTTNIPVLAVSSGCVGAVTGVNNAFIIKSNGTLSAMNNTYLVGNNTLYGTYTLANNATPNTNMYIGYPAPNAPTSVVVAPQYQGAIVSWTASTTVGASVSSYTVTSSPGALTATTVDGITTEVKVTGLQAGTSYTFTVVANSDVGQSIASEPSNAITFDVNVPDRPIIYAVRSNTQLTLTLTPPTYTGSSALVSYNITLNPGNVTRTLPIDTTSTVFTGLANGTVYTISTTVSNAGYTSIAYVNTLGVPSIPTNVAAFPFNNRVLVSWTPSTDEVTQYTITASPGGKTVDVTGTATSGYVTGLTNGTSYTFTVYATNSAGSSAASVASNPVLPNIVRWRGSPVGAATHMGFIDRNGTLYMAGPNATGQLGNGTRTATTSFTSPVNIPGEKVVGVSCSGSFASSGGSAAVTASGKLYTWGFNGYGRLGINNTSDMTTATYVSSLSSEIVVDIAGGNNHNVVITASGKVFAAGANYRYQTGPGSTSDKYVFTEMALPAGELAVNIDCCREGTFIVTQTGNLYFIGHMENVRTTSTLTRITSGIEGEQIASVSGSDNGCIVVTRSGKAFAYGEFPGSIPYTAPRASFIQLTGLSSEFVVGAVCSSAWPMGSTVWTKTGNAYVVDTSISTNVIGPNMVLGISGNVVGAVSSGSQTIFIKSDGTISALNNTYLVGANVKFGNYTLANNAVANTNMYIGYPAPNAPTLVVAVPQYQSAIVSWTASTTAGAVPSSYTVTSSPGALIATTVDGTTTTATIAGLQPGTSYTFTVVANSDVGQSVASEPSNAITFDVNVPDRPMVFVGRSSAQLTVTLTPPTYTGSSALVSYDITLNPGNVTRTLPISTTSSLFTGLTNGTVYTISTTVSNAGYTSIAYVTTQTPLAPTMLSGAPYVTPALTSATITDIERGAAYTIGVAAVTANGVGSEAIAVNTIGIPGIPTNVVALPFNNRVLVSWTAPYANGELTKYTIVASPGGKTVEVGGTETSGYVTGLPNGTSYTFTVFATNSAGSSLASAASNAIIPDIVRWRGASGSVFQAHMAFIDTNGNLYMAGQNAYSQLGDGTANTKSSFDSALIIPGEKIVGVACGGNAGAFTSAVTASGKLYTWGYNYIQLGLAGAILTPLYISSLSTETVIGVSCGYEHSSVVTASGKVFYGGRIGTYISSSTFAELILPIGEIAVNVASAQYATYVTTASGKLYFAGYDNISNNVSNTLTQISSGLGNELVAAISATNAGCIIATRTGKVFGYGDNGSGVLGLGNYNSPINSLTQCTALASEFVVGIATYSQFAMFWTKTGKLYIVGSGPSFSTTNIPVLAVSSGCVGAVAGVNNAFIIKSDGTLAAMNNTYLVGTNTRYGTYTLANNAIPNTNMYTGYSAPNAPTSVVAVPQYQAAIVSWTASTTAGAVPSSYTVTSSPGALTATTVDGITTEVKVTGLQAGTSYTFTVVANSDAGPSISSDPSNSITFDANVPDRPATIAAERGNAQLTVILAPPTYTGTSALVNYDITLTPGNITRTITADTTTAVFTGLANGTEYTISATVTNAGGYTSAPIRTKKTPSTIPNAPTNVVATSSDSSATVGWTPSFDGGAFVSLYTVTAYSVQDATPRVVTSTTLSAAFTGLVNGAYYTFTVTATNLVGTGAASAPSNRIMPSKAVAPSAPQSVVAAGASRALTLAWSAPSSTGLDVGGFNAAIASYKIYTSAGVFLAATTGTSFTITGLTNGTSYSYYVTAVNSADLESVASATFSGMPSAAQANQLAWFDSSDATSLVTSGTRAIGSTQYAVVTGWNDKTGKGNHLTLYPNSQGPAYIPNLNSTVVDNNDLNAYWPIVNAQTPGRVPALNKPGIIFRGGVYGTRNMDSLIQTGSMNAATSAMSIFVVEMLWIPSGSNQAFIATTDNAYTYFSDANGYANYTNYPAISLTSSAPLNQYGFVITGYYSDDSGGTKKIVTRFNGTTKSTSASLANWYGINRLRLSGRGGVGNDAYSDCAGILNEMLIFNQPLTLSQVQDIEGYLATKWGLQSSLAAGHPYKTSPYPYATLGGSEVVATAPAAPTAVAVSNVNGGSLTISWTASANPGTSNGSTPATLTNYKVYDAYSPATPLAALPQVSMWSSIGPSLAWKCIAASADGTKLAAGVSGGNIYVSSDSGATWTARGPSNTYWNSITMSADGTTLAAVSDKIFVSTDSGVTWTIKGNQTRSWSCIRCSANGTKMAAAETGGMIYLSSDSGNTWSWASSGASGLGSSLAMSDDGNKIVAAMTRGYVRITSDFGASWSQKLTTQIWVAIACSSDGNTIAVAGLNTQIYISNDFGSTWTTKGSSSGWQNIAMSADGTRLAAYTWAPNGVPLSLSTDSGNTWTTAFSNKDWNDVKFSSNNSLYALVGNEPINVYAPAVVSPGSTLTVNLTNMRTDDYALFVVAVNDQNLTSIGSNVVFVSVDAPATVPDAPTNVVANVSAAPSQAVVTWSIPAYNGGRLITGYTVTASPADVADVTVSGAFVNTVAVTGLTNGTSYTFTVKAINSVGSSAASVPSAAVIPFRVPDAPTLVSSSATGNTVTLNYAAPAFNGGSAITKYIVNTTSDISPAFDPSVLGTCEAWFDAADSRSFLLSSGTNIANWYNKADPLYSAYARTIGGYAAPQLVSAGRNGRNIVSFSSSNDIIIMPKNFNSHPITFCIAVNIVATADGDLGIIGTGRIGRGLGFRNNYFQVGWTNAPITTNVTFLTGTWYVLSVQYASANATTAKLRVNGTEYTVDGLTISPNITDEGLYIAEYSNIQVGDAFVFTSAMSADQLANVESYMAAKWNISLSNTSATTMPIMTAATWKNYLVPSPGVADQPLQYQLLSNAANQVGYCYYTNLPVANYSSLVFACQINWLGGNTTTDGYGLNIGDSVINSGNGIQIYFNFNTSYTNNGFSGAGIYLLKNNVALAKSSTSPGGAGTNVWYNVQVVYTKSVTNTWTVNINNTNALTYSDPDTLTWVANAGSIFSIFGRSGNGPISIFVRNVNVTGYTYAVPTSLPGYKLAEYASSGTTATLSNLAYGFNYTFTVYAYNARGVSASPLTISNVATDVGVPAKVLMPIATLAGNVAQVNFAAAYNSGSAITQYTVTALPGGATQTAASAGTLTFTSLTAGQEYKFTVSATNAVGAGTASATTQKVIPFAAPGVVSLSALTLPGGFAPADIKGGLVVWLDASDATTYTLSGGNLTQWRNKLGDYDHAYPDLEQNENYPTVGTSVLNGQNVILMSNARDMILNDAYNADEMTITMVMKIAGTPSVETLLYYNLLRRLTTTGITSYVRQNDTQVLFNGNGIPNNTWCILTMRFSQTRQLVNIRVNGLESSGATAAYAGLQAVDKFRLAGRILNVAEFMIYKTWLSDSAIKQLELYEVQKWGLSATYNDVAPTLSRHASVSLVPAIAAKNKSITLNWVPPVSENGARTTSYTITLSTGGNVIETAISTIPSTAFIGLANDTTYTVAITAVNAAGLSTAVTTIQTPTEDKAWVAANDLDVVFYQNFEDVVPPSATYMDSSPNGNNFTRLGGIVKTIGGRKGYRTTGAGGNTARITKSFGSFTSMTYVFWVRPEQSVNDSGCVIFSRNNGNVSGIQITSLNVRHHWNDTYYWQSTSANVVLNVWQHVAVVFTPTQSQWYVNGVLMDTKTQTYATTTLGEFYIGCDAGISSRNPASYLDDCGVFNVALSQSEIVEIMNNGYAGIPANKIANTVFFVNFNNDPEPVMYDASAEGRTFEWAGNATVSSVSGYVRKPTIFFDSTPNNNNFEILGGTVATISGRIAYRTTGAGNSTTRIIKSFGSFTSMTYMFWIRPEQSLNDYCAVIFSRYNGSTNGIHITNLNVRHHWNGGYYDQGTSANLTLNTWQHVAVVFTPTQAQWYVNGTLVDTKTQNYYGPITLGEFYLGCDPYASSRNPASYLDDCGVFNVALSQSEIVAIMNNGYAGIPAGKIANAVFFQTFNNTDVQDSLLLTRTAYRADTTGNSSANYLYAYTSLLPMTYSFWINPIDSSSNYGGIIYSRGSNGTTVGVTLVGLNLRHNWNGAEMNATAVNLNVGMWQHVAVVVYATYALWYLNGRLADVTYNTYNAVSPGMFALGYDPTGGRPLAAYLDDCTVFKRALTLAEIMNIAAVGAGTIVAGPPGQPIGVTATTTTSGSAVVSWSAPRSNGSPITSYTITSSPGGLTASVASTSLTGTVYGLTNGVSYTFTVTATNASGTGAASAASNSVTPFAVKVLGSGTDLIGYTLVVCATPTAAPVWSRYFDFNDGAPNASGTVGAYIYATPKADTGYPRFTASISNGWQSESSASSTYFTTVTSRLHIYTIYFQSATLAKVNAYYYTNNALTEMPLSSSTITYGNTILSRLTNFWLGRSLYAPLGNPYFDGSYSQVVFYPGDLSVNSPTTNILKLIQSPNANTMTSYTYTFGGAAGFVGATVARYGETYGDSTKITIASTGANGNGYLNITHIGSDVPQYTPSLNLPSLIGYTLVLCATPTAYGIWPRYLDFNTGGSGSQIMFITAAAGGGSNKIAVFTNTSSASASTYTTVLSRMHILSVYVQSETRVKVNAYYYTNNVLTEIEMTANTFPYNTTNSAINFWLGRSTSSGDTYFDGSYSQVALYPGDLSANSPTTNIMNLIQSPNGNSYNTGTYTFGGAAGFIGATVQRFGTTTASSSNIALNPSGSGYLSIMGANMYAPIPVNPFSLGSALLGKTLVLCATPATIAQWSRFYDFNDNVVDTGSTSISIAATPYGATNNIAVYATVAGGNNSNGIRTSTYAAVAGRMHIMSVYFQSTTVAKANTYYYTNNTLTEATMISTNTAPSVWTSTSQNGIGGVSMSCSDNGNTIGMRIGNVIYVSVNGGLNWTLPWAGSAPAGSYGAVSVSASGQFIVTTLYGGQIHRSTNYGSTWNVLTNSPSKNWSDIHMSSDGTKIIAAPDAANEKLWLSTDSGTTWQAIQNCPAKVWKLARISDDGMKMVGCAGNGDDVVYISTNGGSSWTANLSARIWRGITVTRDFSMIAVTVENGYIYTSTNLGASWNQRDQQRNWKDICCSADGSILAATVRLGDIYLSTDSGVTWSPTGASGLDWSCVKCNADGTIFYSSVGGGMVYKYGLPRIAAANTLSYGSNMLSSIVNLWLGRSQTSSNPYLAGSYSQVAVYDGDLSANSPTTRLLNLIQSPNANTFTPSSYVFGGAADFTGVIVDRYNTTVPTSTEITLPSGGNGFLNILGSGVGQAPQSTASVLAGEPQLFTATAGNKSITVNWQVPSYLGTGTLTGYYVTASVNGVVVANVTTLTTTFSTTLIGLEAGVNHTVGVAAVTTMGYGSVASLIVAPTGSSFLGNPLIIQNTLNGYIASMACSQNGKYVTAVYGGATGGPILRSTDYGATFTGVGTSAGYGAVAMSFDGKYQLAASTSAFNTYLSIDYGVSWSAAVSGGTATCKGAALSANGKIQYTAVDGVGIYKSSDYGVSWSLLSGTAFTPYAGNALTCSADGNIVVAVRNGTGANAFIMISYNAGATWTQQTALGIQNWTGCCMSGTGKYMTAVGANGYVRISSDFGATWSAPTTGVTTTINNTVTCSVDGKFQCIAGHPTNLFYSRDFGMNWVLIAGSSTTNWSGSAISALAQYFWAVRASSPFQLQRSYLNVNASTAVPTVVLNPLRVINTTSSVTILWSKPASNADDIYMYTITNTKTSEVFYIFNDLTNTNSLTITGLVNDSRSYIFSIMPTNMAGDGPISRVGNAEPPGPPSNAEVTISGDKATVSWTAPTENGGAAITSYNVIANPGNVVYKTPDANTTFVVTGLYTGTNYSFTVSANNVAGAGPASSATAAAFIIPTPSGVSAAAGDGQAYMRWFMPAGNYDVIVNFTVTATSASGSMTQTTSNELDGLARNFNFTGLTNGVAYTFTVRANTSNGSSPESNSTSAVTPSATNNIIAAVNAATPSTTSVAAYIADQAARSAADVLLETKSAIRTEQSNLTQENLIANKLQMINSMRSTFAASTVRLQNARDFATTLTTPTDTILENPITVILPEFTGNTSTVVLDPFVKDGTEYIHVEIPPTYQVLLKEGTATKTVTYDGINYYLDGVVIELNTNFIVGGLFKYKLVGTGSITIFPSPYVRTIKGNNIRVKWTTPKTNLLCHVK